MTKAVNDTNVWVAGIHWNRGAGYLIRQRWAAGEFEHLTSGDILFEIIRVLREVFHYPDELLYQWQSIHAWTIKMFYTGRRQRHTSLLQYLLRSGVIRIKKKSCKSYL